METTQQELPLEESSTEGVTTHDIKIAVCRLVDLKTEYAEKKEIAEAHYKQVKEAEGRIIELLEKAELDSFKVPNVGTATRGDRLSWPTPKGIEDKKAFFKQLQEKLGDDGFWTYVSVNSRSLQTYCKDALEGGETAIDGLEPPISSATLRFTKARA